MLVPINPDPASLQQGLLPGAETVISDVVTILIPRDTCSSFTHMCAVVNPGVNSTYSLPPSSTTNIKCIDITTFVNCDGEFINYIVLLLTLRYCT